MIYRMLAKVVTPGSACDDDDEKEEAAATSKIVIAIPRHVLSLMTR